MGVLNRRMVMSVVAVGVMVVVGAVKEIFLHQNYCALVRCRHFAEPLRAALSGQTLTLA